MGYLTTFTVYNDDCHLINEHPKQFAEAITKACSQYHENVYPLGNHCNLITAQGTRHADDHTIYVHMGNTLTEMNAYSSTTKELLEEHTKFYKELLNLLERQTKMLKKLMKEHKAAVDDERTH